VKFLTFIFISLLLFGCGRLKGSDAADNGIFPASVGNFKRGFVYKEKEQNYINDKNKNQKYKSNQAEYSDGTDKIFYSISTHQKAEDAINEQEKEALYLKNSVWKTVDLKDKSGKNVGKLTICRNYDKSPNSVVGNTNYSLAFNVDNQNHDVALSDLARTWTPEMTDKFVAFVKALPAASQLDLSMLDLLTSGSSEKLVTADKLSAISPPVKLAAAPYLRGKTAVISTGTFNEGVVTDEYVKDAARQANLMEEVGSIVKVECAKSASIGQYVVKDKGTTIPAFGSACKMTIIDNTIPAIIAQKTFTNSTMVDNYMTDVDKNGKLYNYNKEYVAPFPTRDIADFLEKLPKK
jgi:hypothetical protein